jgi:peptide/nickel transport system permease protein/oligopeptide transport system permease protein
MTDSTLSQSPASVEIAGMGTGPGEQKERSGSLWSDALRDLRRKPVFIVSTLIVLVVLSMAAFPGLWTDSHWEDPGFAPLGDAKLPPSGEHIFGTSLQGGDLYTLLVYGARPSIVIGVVGATGITLIGILLGTVAGYFGGLTDTLISRFTDIVMGLPFILGAIVLLSTLRSRSPLVIAFVLIAFGWTTITRVMRGSVLQTKNMDFIEAARALGARNRVIVLRHILPNAIAPVLVLSTILVGVLIGAEATLTFLGIGLQPPSPSWGIQIQQGTVDALNGSPHLLIFPCAILVITVLSFVLLGDALRDALDPKIR